MVVRRQLQAGDLATWLHRSGKVRQPRRKVRRARRRLLAALGRRPRMPAPKSEAGRRTVSDTGHVDLPTANSSQDPSCGAIGQRDLRHRDQTAGGCSRPRPAATDPRADNRTSKRCARWRRSRRRLHDLRHSAATMMLDNDLDLKTVGQLLGHSQLADTGRYTHVCGPQIVAAQRIDQALFRSRPPTPEQKVSHKHLRTIGSRLGNGHLHE